MALPGPGAGRARSGWWGLSCLAAWEGREALSRDIPSPRVLPAPSHPGRGSGGWDKGPCVDGCSPWGRAFSAGPCGPPGPVPERSFALEPHLPHWLSPTRLLSFFLPLAFESTGLLYQASVLSPLPPRASESSQVLSVGNLTRQATGPVLHAAPLPLPFQASRACQARDVLLKRCGASMGLILTELSNSC